MKLKHHSLIQAIFYTILAIVLLIYGIIKSKTLALIGAILVGACAIYWTFK